MCQSGNHSRVRKRHACSRPFRNTLYQYAWASLQKEWAVEYYRRKRNEGKSHTMALRALANQWVRIIHALWIKGVRLTTRRYSNGRRRNIQRAPRDRVITEGPKVYAGKVLWSSR